MKHNLCQKCKRYPQISSEQDWCKECIEKSTIYDFEHPSKYVDLATITELSEKVYPAQYFICDNCLKISKEKFRSEHLCVNCYTEMNWETADMTYKINYYFNKIFKCYTI